MSADLSEDEEFILFGLFGSAMIERGKGYEGWVSPRQWPAKFVPVLNKLIGLGLAERQFPVSNEWIRITEDGAKLVARMEADVVRAKASVIDSSTKSMA